MSKQTVAHLEALRAEMARLHVDAMIVPGTDAHQSEYICEYWKSRDWVSGFTGSNGTAVVTLDDARLWTDSRYFLQAQQQLADSGFTMMKEAIAGEPTITEWLASVLAPGGVIAIDGTLFSINSVNALEEFCGLNGLRLATDFTPFDTIWPDRPLRPQGKIEVHSTEYSGESVADKLARTLSAVEAAGADALFIAALDEIAWLYNIRCTDVRFTPVTISYAYISASKKAIFVDSAKLTPEVSAHFAENGIEVLGYDDVARFLDKLPLETTVMLDPNQVSDTLNRAIECGRIFGKSPISMLKGVKNDVQIEGMRRSMVRDGIALVKTFRWVEENAASGTVTELGVWNKAMEMRRLDPMYRGDSFSMIAGYKEHGAIVHYSADEQSDAHLQAEGLLLVDTGAQYPDGTTDITRTITLGNPTADEIHDYTLVLKGHVALASQQFPVGTRGVQLDVLARQYLWNEGLAYLHGTGHGVGQYLSVHEGPHSIRMNENPVTIVPGMITSDEPGLYRAGKHGVRIENLVLAVNSVSDAEFGDFMKFETLTLFPYDARLIDVSMLTDGELSWINDYHATVRECLLPGLDGADAEWLIEKTKKITR